MTRQQLIDLIGQTPRDPAWILDLVLREKELSFNEGTVEACLGMEEADGRLAQLLTKETVAHTTLRAKHRKLVHLARTAQDLLADRAGVQERKTSQLIEAAMEEEHTGLPPHEPDTLPVSCAQTISDLHGQQQVIVVTWDGRQTHCVTYGASLQDSDQAALGGDRLKTAMGWPESLKGMLPVRVKAIQDELLECQAALSRRLQTVVQLQHERDQLSDELQKTQEELKEAQLQLGEALKGRASASLPLKGPLQRRNDLILKGLAAAGIELAVSGLSRGRGCRIGTITQRGETSIVISGQETQQLIDVLWGFASRPKGSKI